MRIAGGLARGGALAVVWMFSLGAVVGDVAARKAAEAAAAWTRGDYAKALQLYRDAQVEKPGSTRLHFNVGDALYKTGDVQAAMRELEQAAASGSPELRARALYNMGNAYMEQHQIGKAVEAYKNALRLRPGDPAAKANLELALKLQQEQRKHQQQSTKDQKDHKSQKSGQKQQSPRKDGEQRQRTAEREGQKPGQKPAQQESAPQQQKSSTPPRQQRSGQEEGKRKSAEGRGQKQDESVQAADSTGTARTDRMDRAEAQRLLDALRDREKQAQLHRMGPPERARGEDW